MADIVKALRDKRHRIEDTLRVQDRREGELKALLDGLNEDFGVSDMEGAKERMEQLGKELDDNEDQMVKLDKEMAAILQAAEDGEVRKR